MRHTAMAGDDLFDRESQLIGRLAGVLGRCVLPLFTESDGRPALVGTGFLVSADGKPYLLSAAHIFDELRDGGRLFFYVEPNRTRTLSGVLRTTPIASGLSRQEDRYDVGVLLMQGPGLPPYPSVEKCCMPIGALVPRALPRARKTYIVTGFPASKTRANPSTRELLSNFYVFRNGSAPAERYAEVGVTERDHLLMSFDRKRAVHPSRDVRAFPDPRGMSGAPVWLLYDEEREKDPSLTPIVGIAIEHLRTRRAILVTDIAVALDLIHHAF